MSTSLTEDGTDSESFTFPQRISMLFGVESAALSGMSITLLVVYKIYRIVRRVRAGGSIWERDACDSSLFLSLMLGDALRAIGKIMTVRWIVEATIVAPTTFCTAQGVIQLLGTNIIDWSTLAITVQTTVVLIAQWHTPSNFAKWLTLGVWAIVALIVGATIGVSGLGIIGPAGSWCWIQSSNRTEQILGEYLWMWIILLITTILYAIDALAILGFITIEGWRVRWISKNRIHLDVSEADNEEELERKEMAIQLAFYPLVYFVCVTPPSITRWLAFSGYQVPHQASAFTSCLFSLSGFFNVILFFKTRTALVRGDIQTGPAEALPDLQPPPRSNDGHTSTSALLSAQRAMAEKQPADDLLLEINYSRVRQPVWGAPSVPRNVIPHQQVSHSPSPSPGKYYIEDDVGQLPS